MKIKSLLASTVAATSLLTLGAIAANADTITVKAGDTVSELAETHQTTIAAIQSANRLADVNFILIGQRLEINGAAVSTAATVTAPTKTAPVVTAKAQPATPGKTAQAPQATAPVSAPAQQPATTTATSDSAVKAWIVGKESGGSYTARNGQYIGKYQLSSAYLNGDYSAENQERVAESYVAGRYGSWVAAQNFWQAHGWY